MRLRVKPASYRTPELWPAWLAIGAAGFVAVVGAIGIYFLLTALLGLPSHSPPETAAGREQRKLLVEAFKAALGVAAGLGAVVALTVSFRRHRIEESQSHRDDQRLFTDRFGSAAEHLGHAQPAVRLAGVHAMARLADDWDEQRQTCIDVLCAYLRLPLGLVESSGESPAGKDAAAASTAAASSLAAEREVRQTIVRLIADHLRIDPDDTKRTGWHRHTFDFTSVVFDGSYDFGGARFSGGRVIFAGAQFSGGRVSFAGAQFSGGRVSFEGAWLGEAHLEGANLAGAHLERAILTGAHLEGAILDGAHLEGARLDGAHLEGLDLLYGAHLEGLDLAGAHLEGANLAGAHLEGANLDGARLDGAFLHGAHLEGARLDGARLDGARLDGARLDGARLDGARLDGAFLHGAHLDGAILDGAHLDGAILDGAHLEGANLDGAHLDGANLDGAHLDGAILDGAHLEQARLDGAFYDDATQWPQGFDYRAAGVRHLDKADTVSGSVPPSD